MSQKNLSSSLSMKEASSLTDLESQKNHNCTLPVSWTMKS